MAVHHLLPLINDAQQIAVARSVDVISSYASSCKLSSDGVSHFVGPVLMF